MSAERDEVLVPAAFQAAGKICSFHVAFLGRSPHAEQQRQPAPEIGTCARPRRWLRAVIFSSFGAARASGLPSAARWRQATTFAASWSMKRLPGAVQGAADRWLALETRDLLEARRCSGLQSGAFVLPQPGGRQRAREGSSPVCLAVRHQART